MKHMFMLALLAPVALSAQPAAAPKPANAQKSPEKPAVDTEILHVQVILDKLGFAPGVLDGKGGQSLVDAIKGFQESRGLTVTGRTDDATLDALSAFRAWQPVRTLQLTEASLAGPFTMPLPKDPVEQAKLPALNYRNALEALAERFHTTPATLVALNPGGQLAPGGWLKFPNALPTSRDHGDGTGAGDATRVALLNHLNVSADQPKGKRIVVDKSDGVLRVFDAGDRLIAQFPATMGSSRDPLPLGSWTVKGASFNPVWGYDPALLKTADQSDPKLDIPGGPNNPVGVVWLDLSKEHYGIHGTNEPQQIGRAQSNGCIRLTNWDAARLAVMIEPGTVALFQA